MSKERVDLLAFRQGLFESREQAKRAVMAGLVIDSKNGQRFDKAGEKIDASTELKIKGEKLKYVSRGGLKLEKALKTFAIDVKGKVALDIGASTGGFTDLMLQEGAQLVYAIDVGTNQLAWKLRQDERVISKEQFNFRYATKEDFPDQIAFTSIDVSFISLDLILPPLYDILEEGGQVVALVKPQFEAGKEFIGKNGIVRDAKVHQAVLEKVIKTSLDLDYTVKGLDYSPIQGGHGNTEFLLYLSKGSEEEKQVSLEEIKQVVERAKKEFVNE